MSFVSYAQNFEDVMLWRALKHVENGVYVDVGAQHPLVDSVSKAFYEHGWRGVHVEPVQAYADLLRQDRPDETVLQVALAEADGVLELNVIPETGLSTAVDAYAERHLAEHGFAHTTVRVPMLTLKSALQWLEGKDVHWLKIDVEGLEERVLRGWDPAVLRPWIMVIEATVPTSAETDFAGWEPLVTGAGYRLAYFDGLNRFYVADEHPELLAAFASPPNVFDAARLSGLASSELCRGLMIRHDADMARLDEHARAQGQELAQRIAGVESELAQAREQLQARDGELAAARQQVQSAGQALAAERELSAHLRAEVAALREFARLHAHIEWMQGQCDGSALREQERERAVNEARAAAEQARRDLQSMHASTSWRITAPLRRSADLARGVKRVPRRTARAVLGRALANPAVKARALRVLAAAPGLEQGIRKLAIRAGLGVSPVVRHGGRGPLEAPPAAPVHAVDERVLRELSPRATRILAEIHKAIDNKGQ